MQQLPTALRSCPRCRGTVTGPGVAFCPRCGTSLRPQARPPSAWVPPPGCVWPTQAAPRVTPQSAARPWDRYAFIALFEVTLAWFLAPLPWAPLSVVTAIVSLWRQSKNPNLRGQAVAAASLAFGVIGCAIILAAYLRS